MDYLAAPSQVDAGATDKPLRAASQDLPCKMRLADAHQPPPDACFDCNICLDFAADPVVTLCGHLYCWSCIYKWLRVPDAAQFDPDAYDAAASSVPRQQQCPVCKAALSESALVPLYGRGIKGSPRSAAALPVPRRPLPSTRLLREDPFDAGSHMMTPSPPTPPSYHQRRVHAHTHGPARHVGRDYLGNVMSSTTVVHPLFHGVAMLPFLLFCGTGAGSSSGLYYADPYDHDGRGVAERRQEMRSARSLNRISCFLFLCILLCLLLF